MQLNAFVETSEMDRRERIRAKNKIPRIHFHMLFFSALSTFLKGEHFMEMNGHFPMILHLNFKVVWILLRKRSEVM